MNADHGPGRRQELKFVAPETSRHELVAWLRTRRYGFRTAFPTRRVNNAYFDRPDFHFYSDSIDGVSARTKIRYRWYGTQPFPDAGRLEIKQRRARTGTKYDYPVPTLDGTLETWPDVVEVIRDAVEPEAHYWLVEHGTPVILNRYEREYWVSGDGRIRVTFDRDHRAYDQRYGSAINVTRPALVPRTIIMEVKCATAAAPEVSALLATLPLPLTRHSKYCNAVAAVQGY